jgi:hypothetical protein
MTIYIGFEEVFDALVAIYHIKPKAHAVKQETEQYEELLSSTLQVLVHFSRMKEAGKHVMEEIAF